MGKWNEVGEVQMCVQCFAVGGGGVQVSTVRKVRKVHVYSGRSTGEYRRWAERWVSGSNCITLGEVQVGVHWGKVQWGEVQWVGGAMGKWSEAGEVQVGIVGGYYAMLWLELVGVHCKMGKSTVSTVGGWSTGPLVQWGKAQW